MKNKAKRLSLSRETLRILQARQLRGVAGGGTIGPDCASQYPLNCNCTIDESGCGGIGGNTCGGSNCPSCDPIVMVARH